MKSNKTLFLVQFSILLAIEVIFCFTPLGSLPALGPIVITLAMIPVIITSITLGTKAGTIMGALTGLFSLIVWTFMPPNPLVAFVFTPFYSLGELRGNVGSLIICFVPRALVGTVAGISYKALSQTSKKNMLSMSISAALGSLTNTFLVLGGIWMFFGNEYATIAGDVMLKIIGATILTNGIPEAIACILVVSAVCHSIQTVFKRKLNNV